MKANGNATIRYARDVFDNIVATCFFAERMQDLRFEIEIDLELEEKDAFDFILESYAVEMPFSYAADLAAVVAPYLKRQTGDELEIPGWKYPTSAEPRGTVSAL